MDPGEVRHLLAFNRWANDLILATAESLSPEAFCRDLKSSFASVRDTLVHVLWAEWVWLERCRGRSPTSVLDPLTFPTVESLRHGWRPVAQGLGALVDGLTLRELGRVIGYTNRHGEHWEYPLESILRHVVNHSTFHRGQVVTLLRQLGIHPPTTDLLVFVDVGSPGVGPDA